MQLLRTKQAPVILVIVYEAMFSFISFRKENVVAHRPSLAKNLYTGHLNVKHHVRRFGDNGIV